MDLHGKIALVTGGSGDIGRAICDALAAAGADIALTYVGNVEAAQASLARVTAAGRRAVAIHLDQRPNCGLHSVAATSWSTTRRGTSVSPSPT